MSQQPNTGFRELLNKMMSRRWYITAMVLGGFILIIGGFITNKLTGGDEKEATPVQQAAPVINIQNTQTQQQAAGGKTVVIKEKEVAAKPAAPVKKKEGDEFKEEAPKW